MKIGNYEFPEIIGRDDGKLYVCPYTSPDRTLEIVPVVNQLKGTVMPVELQAYKGGLYVKSIALPPNNQQDVDEWNFITQQGLTFENLPSRYVSPRIVSDFGEEILSRLQELKELIQAK